MNIINLQISLFLIDLLLQLHEHYGTPSGWTIWKPGDY
jgi:hypothetical protein